MGRIKSHKIVPEAARPQLNCDMVSDTGIYQDIYFGTIISKNSKTGSENMIMKLIELSEDEIIGKR